MKHAACGILRRTDGAVFMQQRRAPQTFAGFWEFPGGKINPGETAAAAVRRELAEEIGITARRLRHFVRRRYRYETGDELLLDFFLRRRIRGRTARARRTKMHVDGGGQFTATAYGGK